MKRTIAQTTKALALLGALTATALQIAPAQAADSTHHSINARQNHQQKRIVGGIKNETLTAREAAALEAREAHLARIERQKRLSGDKFTKRERANIQHRENKTSRYIYHQKHDSQNR